MAVYQLPVTRVEIPVVRCKLVMALTSTKRFKVMGGQLDLKPMCGWSRVWDKDLIVIEVYMLEC